MSDTCIASVSQNRKNIDIIDELWMIDSLSDDGKFRIHPKTLMHRVEMNILSSYRRNWHAEGHGGKLWWRWRGVITRLWRWQNTCLWFLEYEIWRAVQLMIEKKRLLCCHKFSSAMITNLLSGPCSQIRSQIFPLLFYQSICIYRRYMDGYRIRDLLSRPSCQPKPRDTTSATAADTNTTSAATTRLAY